MRGMVWYKKDLRVQDNPALYYACKQCDDGVIAVYILDIEMWKKNNTGAIQIEFILRGLEELKNSLYSIGIPLLIINTKKSSQIPQALHALALQNKIEKLFYNQELEINETRRDQAVTQFFAKNNIATSIHHDQLIIFPYDRIRTKAGGNFKVFTAFKQEWLRQLPTIHPLPIPKIRTVIPLLSSHIPNKLPGISSGINPQLWPAGEKYAYQHLNLFIKDELFSYDKKRDFPVLNCTSKLSPYLATGMISVQTCFKAALKANSQKKDSGNEGALTWMSELIWREFYRHILITTPRVCMNKAYKLTTEKLPWRYDKTLIEAWQQGKTGFPIIDAAMRQLNTTGWMHNRLRMIVAMFFSKNLFLDWRIGEAYFANHLIDYDFASNNGGWQWSASTGTDSVPYFRIFNPLSQSKRFDPEGEFIRKYCPELNKFEPDNIHAPYQSSPLHASKTGYPKPIVDYVKSRQQAIAAFRALV